MFKRLFITAALLLTVSVVHAQEDVSPALEYQLITLEETTQQIRALNALEDVERVFPTRADTIEYLRNLYERDLPVEEAERAEAFYVALGLFSNDVDLREVYLKVKSSNHRAITLYEECGFSTLSRAGELQLMATFRSSGGE